MLTKEFCNADHPFLHCWKQLFATNKKFLQKSKYISGELTASLSSALALQHFLYAQLTPNTLQYSITKFSGASLNSAKAPQYLLCTSS